jgi:DNA-binding transcriptional LysR family regulator
MGVALLPSSLKDYAGPNVCFLPLDMESEHTQYAIVAAWKTSSVNPSLKHLTDLILQ